MINLASYRNLIGGVIFEPVHNPIAWQPRDQRRIEEWSAPELCFGYGGGFSRAKVEMLTSSVSVSLSEISAQRTRLHVELSALNRA